MKGKGVREMLTDSVDAGLVCILMLSHEGMLGGCHLPMTNVYRGKARERIKESVLGFRGECMKVFRCLCARQEKAPFGALFSEGFVLIHLIEESSSKTTLLLLCILRLAPLSFTSNVVDVQATVEG